MVSGITCFKYVLGIYCCLSASSSMYTIVLSYSCPKALTNAYDAVISLVFQVEFASTVVIGEMFNMSALTHLGSLLYRHTGLNNYEDISLGERSYSM